MMPDVTGGIKPYLNYRNKSAPPNMSELSRLAGIFLEQDEVAKISRISSPKRPKVFLEEGRGKELCSSTFCSKLYTDEEKSFTWKPYSKRDEKLNVFFLQQHILQRWAEVALKLGDFDLSDIDDFKSRT